MKLISIITPDRDCDCDYALIDLNPEFARSVLRRIAALKQIKAIFANLFEMYFWDGHAEHFSPWLAEKAGEAEALAEMLERLPAASGDLLTVPNGFTVPENLCSSVECRQLIVRDDAIAFVAILKHTNIYIYTAEVPLHLLEAAAAEDSVAGSV